VNRKHTPRENVQRIEVICTHSESQRWMVGMIGTLLIATETRRVRFVAREECRRRLSGGEGFAIGGGKCEVGRVTVITGCERSRNLTVFVRRPLPDDPDRAYREAREAAQQRYKLISHAAPARQASEGVDENGVAEGALTEDVDLLDLDESMEER
jgi:hypothetical protein